MTIRPMTASDLPALFLNMQDPEAARMAAFLGHDAGDLDKYLAKWTRLLSDPAIHSFTCEEDGAVVGMVSSFLMEGEREVTYWIAREHWGCGLATAALRHLLAHVSERPIFARAASDNAGSIRVLNKCGFRAIATERSFANARREEIEETVFRLDEPAPTPHALFVRHRAKPGQRARVLEVWNGHVRPRVEANPDHLAYSMYLDSEDPDAIHVYQVFACASAAKAFLSQAWYPEYLKAVGEHIAQPPEIREARVHWEKTSLSPGPFP